jgi:uncharacterized membrane protein YdjX (TVP38/TMEM64 family)
VPFLPRPSRNRKPPESARTSSARSARKPFRLRELPWRRIAAIGVIFGAIGAATYSNIEIETVHARAGEFNAILAFALLVFLPLIGFPASLLHVAAGIRFGAVLGLPLVSASILLQLLASFAIVRIWREPLQKSRWLSRLRERIPQGAHASVTIFTVLLPGAPFAAVNLVLPLLGVPLRTFILCAWPLHTLRSTITVLFGDQSDQLTATRLAVLLAYALTVSGASWWMYRRMKSQFEDQPPAAGGRKQPA